MAAEAPSQEELNQSILQKKENFHETVASFLNSQDEAKLSAKPVDLELRWPELIVATSVPGVYGSPFGYDLMEVVNRAPMIRKHFQDEAERSVGPKQVKLTWRELSELKSVPGAYKPPFLVDTILAINHGHTLEEKEGEKLSEQVAKKELEQSAKKALEKVEKKKKKKGKKKKKKKKEGKKEEEKEEEKDEKKVEKKEGTKDEIEEETKDETKDEKKGYICYWDQIDAWLKRREKEAVERESRMIAAGRRYVRLSANHR